MITITPHSMRKIYSHDQLNLIVTILKMHYTSMHLINWAFEYGSKYKKLHLHLLVRSRPLYYKGYTSIDGFQVRYDPLYTQSAVHNTQLYISKNKYLSYSFKI